VIRTPIEIDAAELRREALKHAARPLTGAHAAAEGAMDREDSAHAADDRVAEDQEQAGRGPGILEGVADAPKSFRDAYQPPAEYPQSVHVNPGDFRRGPVTGGHEALSPGWQPPSPGPAPHAPTPWAYLGQPPGNHPSTSGDCA
jgi:hypothetical protein